MIYVKIATIICLILTIILQIKTYIKLRKLNK